MFGHIALSMPLEHLAFWFDCLVLRDRIIDKCCHDGCLYDKDDERRDAGFSIYVFGIGRIFCLTILVGWFQVNVNFHIAH